MTCVQDILRQYDSFKIPRLDLELLVAHVLDCSRARLYSHPEQKLIQTKVRELKQLAKKRGKGMPLAYLTNQKEFYGLNFYVDERVLIPRPETELIIDAALKTQPKTILDIGIGSGTIALTLATKLPSSKITGLDISRDALDVAELNAERFNLDIELLQSDLLDKIEPKSHFDLITANLPYIGELDQFDSNEPAKALFAGKDGLDLYRRLFAELLEKKITFNHLLGEFGFGQEKAIKDILNEKFPGKFKIKNDLAGIPRMFNITQ